MTIVDQQLSRWRIGQINWQDWLGVAASIACAIHCAAMPFIGVFLPMLGLSFLMNESFHQVMVVVCSTFAIAAFIPGFRRHRRLLPAFVGVIGLTLISTAAFALEGDCCQDCVAMSSDAATSGTPVACTEACCAPQPGTTTPETGETATPQTANIATASFLGPFMPWMTPLGGLLLVAAHLTNRQFSCRCGCCSEKPDVDVIETVE